MKKPKDSAAEGGVYACTWRGARGRFVFKCAAPKLQVEAGSLAEGEEALQGAIMAATGDGEPFLEFDPPMSSKAATRQTRPEYFDVGWNDSVQWNVPADGVAALYEDGVCPRCAIGQGKRTTVQRRVTSVPRYDFAGFYKDRSRGAMFSERVCERLLEQSPSSIQAIEVIFDVPSKTRLKQRYYELSVGSQATSVYPRDLTISSGWRCPRCGRANMFISSQIAGNARYCLRQSEISGAVVFVQYGPWNAISISKELRRQFVKDRQITGLVTEQVAVLNADEIMPKEKVPLRKLKVIEV